MAQEVLKQCPALLKRVAVDVARRVIAEARDELKKGRAPAIAPETLVSRAIARAKALLDGGLVPVINATGIIVHTNLGRAPLAEEAVREVARIAGGYSNLEFNLERAGRGERIDAVRDLVTSVCGGEDALVVNNNAAAVLLVLSALARGGEVIVSRGELVEIGGSFRIPDVMEQSGAILREVGTTNKTRPRDYERAIGKQTALLLKAHRSNFRVIGFTEEVDLRDLVSIGRRKRVPVYFDLGSGSIVFYKSGEGEPIEPIVREVVATGVDLVSFSGDKLLGGPQAGIIVGKRKQVQKLARHPLYRALRPDKMTLAALAGTLRLYAGTGTSRVPVIEMFEARPADLRRRAERVRRAVQRSNPRLSVSVRESVSYAGGGSLPMERLSSFALVVSHPERPVDQLAEILRNRTPAVTGRISGDKLWLDFRTVRRSELAVIARALLELS